jgi:tRNA modification GTPase
VEQFRSSRHTPCAVADGTRSVPATLLQRAPTLRTAAILLDQLHGAFDRETARILELLESPVGQSPTHEEAGTRLRDLARWAPVGRHLVEPWKVVVAGAPNVGKSSLVNALAGYQRAVVSEVAGTTRDLVSVQLAIDGWPVELIDTAGLREAEGLEAEGISLVRRAMALSDLVIWLKDACRPGEINPREKYAGLVVWNKSDLATEPLPGLSVSALTGAGLPEFVAAILRVLVPEPPPPGAAVPYSHHLADLVAAADRALTVGRAEEAVRLLRACLDSPG